VSPNLYDVLDVEPDASADEIRAAWKRAIADLGPGDRRFRAYNQAAEVLLDPQARAAYDAQLAAEDPAWEPEPTPEPEPGPEPSPAPVVLDKPDPEREPGPEPDSEPDPEPERVADGARSPIATWLLAAVGLVAAAVLVVTAVVWTTYASDADEPSKDTEQNASAALTAAEQAAVPVLSYDYRSFDEGIVDAESHMTTDYRAEHSQLMNDLRSDATAQKAIVRAEFKGSGIVRVTDDRADILVLINQVIQKEGTADFVLPVWATLQMVEEDGAWLVDSVTNEGAVGG
jgi:Mce-associated membrane protein